MSLQQKVKVCCDIRGITLKELGAKLGMSQQNFSKRLKVGKFTQAELEEIAKALNCEYHSYFIFADGSKIE